jgi:hypothetical protein
MLKSNKLVVLLDSSLEGPSVFRSYCRFKISFPYVSVYVHNSVYEALVNARYVNLGREKIGLRC